MKEFPTSLRCFRCLCKLILKTLILVRIANIFYDHVSRDWKWLLCQGMCLSGGKILQVTELFNLVRAPENLFTSLTLQKAEKGRLPVYITCLTKEETKWGKSVIIQWLHFISFIHRCI